MPFAVVSDADIFRELLFVHSSLAVLCLGCCAWASCGCSAVGLLPTGVRASLGDGFSAVERGLCGPGTPAVMGAVGWLRALECRPNSCGTWDSSLQGTWDLPGSGMEPRRLPWQWILDHRVTRKALTQTLLKGIKLV